MFKTIQKTIPQDKSLPQRAYDLMVRRAVLKGKLYDKIDHPFHYEKSESNEYIPLRKRRPSVRSNLCRVVVDDSVSLLFSENNFPTIEVFDAGQKKTILQIAKECSLNDVMIDAATRGSIGSVAIMFKVLKGRVFLSVMDTDYLTPSWDKDEPDTLESVKEKRIVDGQSLRDAGYTIKDDELKARFWFMRKFTDSREEWYIPLPAADDEKTATLDAEKTVEHGLGFVPVVWVKNLPNGDDIDGQCTFPNEAIDTQIEIDYQLSQAGRALKFMGDPTLMLKGELESGETELQGGAENVLQVGKDGDAKLLEINGNSTDAVMKYVTHLREVILEGMHGNRASNEKMSAAQSGRALELLNNGLIWLADRLRISYGENAILEIARMIVLASNKFTLNFKDGTDVGRLDPGAQLSLRWPHWFTPTMQDMIDRATALQLLCNNALMSRETAIRVLSGEYDILDAQAEKLLADADMKERNDMATKSVSITE